MTLKYTSTETIKELIALQRKHFANGLTRNISYRKDMLQRLRLGLKKWESDLYSALWNDLHKSQQEAYITELSIVYGEIDYALKHLSKWTRSRRVAISLSTFPSISRIVSEPLGCAFIVAPWNYPINLALTPLVGAIAAGCTAIIKCSELVPETSAVIEAMLCDIFPKDYVAVVQGDKEVNKHLFAERFDVALLTGSPFLGQVLMQAQAKYLTPLILELGGKSPCIVDRSADIRLAARRIVWGKCLNSAQTCIAPDYLMLHRDIKDEFVQAFREELRILYPKGTEHSDYYAHLVNDRAFERIVAYLKDGVVIAGGRSDAKTRWIEPTLLDQVSPDSPVMTEEIFGPVLPIQTFGNRHEVIDFVNSRAKPLALYYFGDKSESHEIIAQTSSGGVCVNDVIMHIANHHLPFGGVGTAGMGSYHGYRSFLAFSHEKSILSTPTWIDLPFRYMPYKYFDLIKRFL